MFCLLMVCYEIYSGTRKYMSAPVATTSFSTESEIPSLTLCQRNDQFKMGVLPPFKLTLDDYKNGKFSPELNTSEQEVEENFQKSLNDNYYLLDVTGSFHILYIIIIFYKVFSKIFYKVFNRIFF